MAALTFKRTGFGSGPRGRRASISDAAMSRILAAYRMGAETDDEMTDKIFNMLVQQLLDAAHVTARQIASTTAADAVAKDTATVIADNA